TRASTATVPRQWASVRTTAAPSTRNPNGAGWKQVALQPTTVGFVQWSSASPIGTPPWMVRYVVQATPPTPTFQSTAVVHASFPTFVTVTTVAAPSPALMYGTTYTGNVGGGRKIAAGDGARLSSVPSSCAADAGSVSSRMENAAIANEKVRVPLMMRPP